MKSDQDLEEKNIVDGSGSLWVTGNPGLIASSSNSREYIQRIGRVIRRYPGKKEAQIYDMIVVPDLDRFDPELIKVELKISEKEYNRATYIAANALNSAEALKEIYDKIKF